MASVDGEKISQYVVVPKAIAPDGVATQKSATNIQRPHCCSTLLQCTNQILGRTLLKVYL